jgi:hypothetical protein
MTERKPKLDWIRRVLADDDLHDERAPQVPRLIGPASTIVPFISRPASQSCEVEDGG